MAGKYSILTTAPTVYNDPAKGIINGILVTYRMNEFDEVHEVRVIKMDVKLVKDAIEAALAEREELAKL